jgi:hypothetical protein
MGAPFQFQLTPTTLAGESGKTGLQRRVFTALWEVAESS